MIHTYQESIEPPSGFPPKHWRQDRKRKGMEMATVKKSGGASRRKNETLIFEEHRFRTTKGEVETVVSPSARTTRFGKLIPVNLKVTVRGWMENGHGLIILFENGREERGMLGVHFFPELTREEIRKL